MWSVVLRKFLFKEIKALGEVTGARGEACLEHLRSPADRVPLDCNPAERTNDVKEFQEPG